MRKDLLHLPVTVVAVSKFRTQQEIDCLKEKGFTIFAENRVQELKKKAQTNTDVSWHLIGHLQTNKVKDAVLYSDLIHSVDSFRLLECIDKEAKKQHKVIDVLIQVNIAQEESKFGIKETELIPLLQQAKSLSSVCIKGMMVIAPNTEDMTYIEEIFTKGKQLFDSMKELKQENLDPIWLSMGMSHDYEIAIKCGSNMVRIGTLLFETYASGINHEESA